MRSSAPSLSIQSALPKLSSTLGDAYFPPTSTLSCFPPKNLQFELSHIAEAHTSHPFAFRFFLPFILRMLISDTDAQ